MGQKGKRVGPKRARTFSPALLLLSLGVTLCVVAWGYLVKAAIDFGGEARGGRAEAWWFLVLASLGAVACLFVGLMLVARISRRMGITDPSRAGADRHDEVSPVTPLDDARPRPVGGRRSARRAG